MSFLDAKIDAYLNDLLPPRDPILREMEKYAAQRSFPIVGPLVGRFCQQMALAIKAQSIFEMGSGFGYSAYWMAHALPADGRIVLTERDPANIELARDYFRRGGVLQKAIFEQGDAFDTLQESEGPFDIIFNDVKKERYPETLGHILPRLRTGGLLITDNLLWQGRVVEAEPDAGTRGVLEYTRMVFNSKQLMTTLVPLRDGIGVSLKVDG